MPLRRLVALLAAIAWFGAAQAQAPSGPPAVGVVRATRQAVTETSEFIGRIQAVDRVALTARVTAFLEQRLFTEGTEVKQGDLLYRLERAPFEAAVAQQEAAVADTSARLANANIQLARAQSLLSTPAGQRSSVDDAIANQRSQAAQVASAQAQLHIAQINLDYTEIHAPVSGKISRTNISVGNVVSPSSGPLATIVSQDPMYVTFPIALRAEIDLEKRYCQPGRYERRGDQAASAGRLDVPSGRQDRLYRAKRAGQHRHDPVARQDRQSAAQADRSRQAGGPTADRWRVRHRCWSKASQPVEALAIPRAAVLSDQQGDYVYLVDGQNHVEQRRIQLGQSTPSTAVIMAGLKRRRHGRARRASSACGQAFR